MIRHRWPSLLTLHCRVDNFYCLMCDKIIGRANCFTQKNGDSITWIVSENLHIISGCSIVSQDVKCLDFAKYQKVSSFEIHKRVKCYIIFPWLDWWMDLVIPFPCFPLSVKSYWRQRTHMRSFRNLVVVGVTRGYNSQIVRYSVLESDTVTRPRMVHFI